MSRKGFLVAVLALAATVVMAAPMGSGMGCKACAGGHAGGAKPMMKESGGGMGGMMQGGSCGGPMSAMMSLDLSKEQRAKMHELMTKWHDEKAVLHKGHGKPMLAAFKDGKFDRAVFMAKHAEVATVMAAKKADYIEAMYAVLTDAQKKELDKKSGAQ